jgi:hypothetical protein
MFLSVIDGSFYYFQSNLSATPLLVLGSSQFEDVSVTGINNVTFLTLLLSKEDPTDLYFDVYFKNFTLRHTVRTLELKEMWVDLLGKVRLDSYDLLSKLGILKEQTLKEEVAKEFITKDINVPNINYLDDKKLDKGEQTALIAVVGKSKVVVTLVEPTYKSLRSDSSFVLDIGLNIYQWNGPASSRMSRARAMGVAGRLRKDRGSRPKIHLVDDPNDFQEFLELLGLSKKLKGLYSPPTGTIQIDTVPSFQIFKVVETTIRKRRFQLVYEGNAPSKEILEPDGVYVLSASPGEVFIWNGSKSQSDNRALASVVARRLSHQMLVYF